MQKLSRSSDKVLNFKAISGALYDFFRIFDRNASLAGYFAQCAGKYLISIAGVVPSAFLTAANIIYFGFSGGLFLSILGEASGAVISFFLYRLGMKKLSRKQENTRSHKWIERLKTTRGKEAFILVLLLRIFPFVPSGLVTLAAAFSRMSAAAFMVSSTVGKIPALFIEAYSVHTLLGWKGEYQLAAAAFAVAAGVCYYYWTSKKRNRRMQK